ncbi:ParB/RepB/Spo0J family partition protein [Catenulispora pinisilvae]|uniref:ParB/RepB/Spo0J family partition protein n=1 Tax=Catenulispora pinisilvae TaxID=2705253 RepID=UPI0018923D10|nr:ParB/RepB/Spo0J family partition protein [Catenulispora pinisilvae]
MNDRRRGLGKGLGALIPSGAPTSILSEKSRAESATTSTAEDTVSRETATDVSRETAPAVPVRTALGTLPIDTAPDYRSSDTASIGSRSASVPAPASSPESAFDADLPDGLMPVPGASFAEIPQGQIRPNPVQPRTEFDEVALAELVASIKEVGLLQPIVVRQLAEPEGEHRYELIMGERRWRASQEAGLSAIPAIIRDTRDDRMLLDALLENLQRAQLNPLEEAAAYDQLLKDFDCTHEVLAEKIGKSRPHVTNTLRLLTLTPGIQRRVAAGVITAGHARALLGLKSVEQQEEIAKRIVRENLSVRAVEELAGMGRWDAAALDTALTEPGEDYLDLSEKPKGKRVRSGSRMPILEDFGQRLSDRLETRVKVDIMQKRGRITIEYAGIEDLKRIAKTILGE